jgi:DNA-binding response OmpR family regulator
LFWAEADEMGDRILVVETRASTARAIANVFERHGFRVTVAPSAEEACRHPQRFDCGIFSDQLPGEGGIALAGWLLAEARVTAAVFFGRAEDKDLRLRASNLGTWVRESEGLNALRLAVIEAIGETRLARAVGAEGEELRPGSKTGPRRKRF